MKKRIILGLLLLFHITSTLFAAKGMVDDLYKQMDKMSSKVLSAKAYQYLEQGNNDKALVCYAIIVDRMDSSDLQTIRHAVGAMGNMAYIYSVHEFGKSFVHLNKAIKIAETHHIDDKLPSLYLNMANLLRANETVRTPDHLSDSTIAYYRKCFDISMKVADWETALLAFDNVVSLAIGCQQLSDTRPFLDLFKQIKPPSSLPNLKFSQLHYNVARALERGEHNTCQQLLDKMAELPICKENVRAYLMVISDKANIYYQVKDYTNCIKVSNKAIRLANSHGERDVAVSFYDYLTKCYLATHDQSNYKKYYLKYLEQKDSLYYQNKLLDVDYLKFSSELEGVNERIHIMNLEKRNHKIVAWAAVIIAVLSLIVLISIIASYRRMKKQKWQLFERYQHIMAEHEEKKRLMAQYEREVNSLRSQQHTDDKTPKEKTTADDEDSVTQKYKYNHIDEEMKDEIMARILHVMEMKEEICKDSFSVQRLSELVGWKYNYVAQVIGERFHKNFNMLLAEYRIREACRLIQKTTEYGHLTIEGIAQEVGYKSRSSFSNAFKRVTGLSPSTFSTMAKEKSQLSQICH
ncbi:MAG: helix-turn-helix domain-containing protein [Prevotella sp.]